MSFLEGEANAMSSSGLPPALSAIRRIIDAGSRRSSPGPVQPSGNGPCSSGDIEGDASSPANADEVNSSMNDPSQPVPWTSVNLIENPILPLGQRRDWRGAGRGLTPL